MRIMIIGGTKFIGPFVADQLRQQNHEVTLFHRTVSPLPYPQIQGDCRVVDDLKRGIEQIQPDLIIHMIAMFPSDIETLEKALGDQKIRFILISSADVYKGFEIFNQIRPDAIVPAPFTEASPLRESRFPYRGVHEQYHDYDKILVEELAFKSPVLDTIALRLGMVYGANDPNRRFKDIIHAIHQGDKTFDIHHQLASLKMCRCYVENIAHGIVLASQKGKVGEVYNLAGGQDFTELEWYQSVAKLMGWQGELIISHDDEAFPFVKSVNLMQQLSLSSDKLINELGFSEITPVEEALHKTIEWELQQPI